MTLLNRGLVPCNLGVCPSSHVRYETCVALHYSLSDVALPIATVLEHDWCLVGQLVGIFRQVVRRPSPAHLATSMRRSRFLSAPAAERSSYKVAIEENDRQMEGCT